MNGLLGWLRAHREARAEAPADDDIEAYIAAARSAPITPAEPETDLVKREDT
jgi:hypothetical protein